MAFKREDRLVSIVLRLPVQKAILRSIAIVEAWILAWKLHGAELIVSDRLADVPDFQKLVLAVGSEVDAIALAGDVGDALSVANEDTSWSIARESSSIPDFNHAVVTTRENDVGMLSVSKAHRVDLVCMTAINFVNHAVGHEVIDKKMSALGATEDLFAITGELK